MSLNSLPLNIRECYKVYEFRHANAILQIDFPNEYNDIIAMLNAFKLRKSDIMLAGGRKSPIAGFLDEFLTGNKTKKIAGRGWEENSFDTKLIIDKTEHDTPTHKIDCYKNRIALEIEWNNKDPFFDRDLNNFRLLHERNAISVGVIVTRCSELQKIFNNLGKKIKDKYGQSTTHIGKLLPRIEGGSGGGCPLLVFGITDKLYYENE